MQVHVIITGSVQGVGYRQFVKSNARKLGLYGWVRNNEDGSVESVLQGDKSNIDQLLALCKKGPFLAEVKDIIIHEEPGTPFNFFSVLH